MSRATQTSDHNVHAPEFREAKQPQAGPEIPVSDLFRLDDRTIVITGATGFLGRTAAIAILQSGADVFGLDQAPTPPEADWAQVLSAAEANKQNINYFQCDVTDSKAVSRAFVELARVSRHPLRGLVACAGVSDNGPAIDFLGDSFHRLLDINVAGVFLVAQATARRMRETDVSGSLVFVASMSGYVANKGVDTAGYNASKAAVQQLARSLAAEWGSRVNMPLIRVNSLSPGYIRTAATVGALQKPGMEAQWTGDNMLYRISTVDEFRAPILFLLGDGSSFMTGADLRVDGGHCAW